MSLATRCTECGTVFRVVQDQLKVSEGWVRCGRCSAVFNALENLCEIEPEPAGASAAAPADAMAGAADEPRATEPPRTGHALRDDARFEPPAGPVEPVAHERPPFPSPFPSPFDPGFIAPGVPERGAPAEPAWSNDAEAPALAPPEDERPAAIVDFSAAPPAEPDAGLAAPALAADESPPRFVRAAERAAFWRRTPVRATLGLVSLLLAATLAAQLAVSNRDLLAAHVPALRPALEQLCQPLGCTIQPLRRIDRLTVDSSGLAHVEGAALYRLSVVLRNRADTPLQTPALDLSLTDGAGKLVARRVLHAADLGLPAVVEAGQDVPLQAVLSAGDRRISGYTVELFYP